MTAPGVEASVPDDVRLAPGTGRMHPARSGKINAEASAAALAATGEYERAFYVSEPCRQPSRTPSTTRCATAQRVAAARFDTPILV